MNLCFHGVGVPARALEPGEEPFWIDVDTFFRILDLTTDRADVNLSFDDGNLSDVEIALPALLERGLRATFFVLAGRLNHRGSLGEAEVQVLHSSGMAIGTHGMHHRSWRGMAPREQDAELVQARGTISDALGVPIGQAACPLGQYDRNVLQQLRSLGYSRVHTSDRRWAPAGSWLQPRFSMRRCDNHESVAAQVLTRPRWWTTALNEAKGGIKRLR